MYALITGASSGIGYNMALILANMNYNLILVARRTDRLISLKRMIESIHKVHVFIFTLDLTIKENREVLFNETTQYDVSVLINNAGFGTVGMFNEIDLETEIKMIDLNIICLHSLMKTYLHRMDKGFILNVASVAAFQPGPKMATYYATKAYVLSVSRAINYELKKQKRNISVSSLCPGPVETEFNDVANVKFPLKGIDAKKCANIAIKKMFRRKTVIIPGLFLSIAIRIANIIPIKWRMAIVYNSQKRKG